MTDRQVGFLPSRPFFWSFDSCSCIVAKSMQEAQQGQYRAVLGRCRNCSPDHSFPTKLAIHRRYTEGLFLCILYCYLQGITVRPVPCNYNVIQHITLSRR